MKLNRSAQRMFQIMDYLITARQGATLSEVAKALNEPKTSVYDLLVTGVEMGYLRKHNKSFFMGSQAKKAGRAYVEKQEVLDIIAGTIIEASQKFNVSVSFVVLEKNSLNYLFTQHPDDAVLVARENTPYDFIHASASGKVLLAHSSTSVKNKILSTISYSRFTHNTIVTKEALLTELDKVVAQGYALDDREYSALLQCMAMPIYKGSSVIASLSFSSLNLYRESFEEQLKKLKKTVGELHKLLNESQAL